MISLALGLVLTSDARSPPNRDVRLIEEVEQSGCAEVLDGPACELPDAGRLTLWVRASPQAQLSVRIDDVEQSVDWTPSDGGARTSIEVSTESRRVTIHAETSIDGRALSDVFRLPLRFRAPSAQIAQVQEVYSRSATTAVALLDAIELEPEGRLRDGRLRAEVENLRGRLAFVQGRFDAVVAHRHKEADIASTLGLVNRQTDALAAIAFVAIRIAPDAVRARQVVDELAELALVSSRARVTHAYYEAMLSSLTGDLRAAERWLKRTEQWAVRIGMFGYSTGAAVQRSELLAQRGHFDAAFAVYRDLQPMPGPCGQAQALANRAWIGLMAREVGGQTPFDPEHLSKRALAQLEECPEKHRVPNVLSMLALSRIHAEDAQGALRHVEAARRHAPRIATDVQWWLADVEARAARIQRRYAHARRAYRRLETVAKQRGLQSAQWRAQVGLAAVEEAAGKPRRAALAFAEAERQLDAQGARALFLSPLSVSVRMQQAVARRYASLLMRLGRPEDAVRVLQRQARRRVLGVSWGMRVAALPPSQRQPWNDAVLQYARLRMLGDRLDSRQWGEVAETSVETARQLSENGAAIREALDRALSHLGADVPMPAELPTMPPDEVLIGYDRVADGWLGFAWGSGLLRTVRLAPGATNLTPSRLSDWLLVPFRRELRTFARVRIAARSGLETVDFHALPIDGEPLIRTHAVTYTLGSPMHAPSMRRAQGALVVADPDGNLPGARDEGRFVVDRLRQRRLDPVLLVGTEVRRASILERMDVAILHWAGHGRRMTGTDALTASVLPLGSGAHLTAADVLALPRVPEQVVLAGCETSPVNARHLGVAQAFVLAGAKAVVATSRPVRDGDAQAIGTRLYAASHPHLGQALRSAQLDLRSGEIDWAAFRTIVP